jgi:hypothetical protein
MAVSQVETLAKKQRSRKGLKWASNRRADHMAALLATRVALRRRHASCLLLSTELITSAYIIMLGHVPVYRELDYLITHLDRVDKHPIQAQARCRSCTSTTAAPLSRWWEKSVSRSAVTSGWATYSLGVARDFENVRWLCVHCLCVCVRVLDEWLLPQWSAARELMKMRGNGVGNTMLTVNRSQIFLITDVVHRGLPGLATDVCTLHVHLLSSPPCTILSSYPLLLFTTILTIPSIY